MVDQAVERYSKHAGRHYSAAEVDVQAIEALRLKVLGKSDVVISETMGLSRPTVAKRIRHAIATHGQSTVAEYREIAKQRFEAGLDALVPLIAEGNLDAIRVWLDGTAKYARLVGAEAPVQVEAQVTQVTEQEKELRDLLAQAERDEKAREGAIVGNV